MSKKRKQPRPTTIEIKPRAFVPRPCSACTALRDAESNYSYVYHTAGRIRYCKCKYCNNTWTQTISADQTTSAVVVTAHNSVVASASASDAQLHGISDITTGTDRRGD